MKEIFLHTYFEITSIYANIISLYRYNMYNYNLILSPNITSTLIL